MQGMRQRMAFLADPSGDQQHRWRFVPCPANALARKIVPFAESGPAICGSGAGCVLHVGDRVTGRIALKLSKHYRNDDGGQALKRWLAGHWSPCFWSVCSPASAFGSPGVPSAFALGFIAGLAEFVPLIGPILAAIPALLIASTQDWQTVLLALAVLVANGADALLS